MKQSKINYEKISKKNVKIAEEMENFNLLNGRKHHYIEYMSNLENLNIDIKDKVFEAVYEFPPMQTECIYYSQYIAAIIPNVEIEVGLFLYDGLNENLGINFSKYKENSWAKFQIYGLNSISYIDENKEVWGIHCWNSYKGQHFDCMKDLIFKATDKKRWIDYAKIKNMCFTIPTKDYRFWFSNAMKEIINTNRFDRFSTN